MTRYLAIIPLAVLITCTPATTATVQPTTTTSSTVPTTTSTAVSSEVGSAAPVVVEQVRRPAPATGAAVHRHRGQEATLACIRRWESGGNYQARNGHGHSGAYQFDRQTWHSVGGSGEAADASPEEQDSRAAELYRRRGLQPWSVRERCR